jgi:predicted Zn-dependent protease with MMP-like domain
MKLNEFREIVSEVIDTLPTDILAKLNNVEITVDYEPQAGLRNLAGDSKLLIGLYQGIPLTKRRINMNVVVPDKITIFKNNIEHLAKNSEDIKQLVRKTLIHEIAHFFGIDEKRVRDLEK